MTSGLFDKMFYFVQILFNIINFYWYDIQVSNSQNVKYNYFILILLDPNTVSQTGN